MIGLLSSNALIAVQQLQNLQEISAKTSKRISTGLAVADAYDDGASWSVTTRISSHSAALGALMERRQNVFGLLDLTYKAIDTSFEQLQSLREKAVLAADTSLVGDQRRHVQDAFNSARDRLTATAKEATFNSLNLIDGVGSDRVSIALGGRSFTGGTDIQPEPGEQFDIGMDFTFGGEQPERMRAEIAYRYEWDDGSGVWQSQDLDTATMDPSIYHAPGEVETVSASLTIPAVSPAAVRGRVVASLSGLYPAPDGDEFAESPSVVASWDDVVTGLPQGVAGLYQLVGSVGFGSPPVAAPPSPPAGGPVQATFSIQPNNPADTSSRHVVLGFQSTTKDSQGNTYSAYQGLSTWTNVAPNTTLSFNGNVPAPSTPGRLTSGSLVVTAVENNGTGASHSVAIASWDKAVSLPTPVYATRTWSTKLETINSTEGESLPIRETDLTAQGLGLDTASLATADDARQTLLRIDQAEKTLGLWAQKYASTARSLVQRTEFVNSLIDAEKQGSGAIADADLGKESAKQQAMAVRLQLSQNSLSIANQEPRILLKLFGL
jgi:flagellin-like hook-associated protein FlgL